MDFLVVCPLLVSMVKNKSWHSHYFSGHHQVVSKTGEIILKFIRSKLFPMAIFSPKKSSHMAHPTKLKIFPFRIQHRRKFQITKITSQFICLKKRFVATFSAKKSSHMGVNHAHPERHEEQDGGELHAFRNRADDQRRGRVRPERPINFFCETPKTTASL